MYFEDVRLLEKAGGRSGHWTARAGAQEVKTAGRGE
jgi:hypothetical protein